MPETVYRSQCRCTSYTICVFNFNTLSPFSIYLTCNCDDLELGQFKVIQGQRLCCQSIAPATSIDPNIVSVTVSKYLMCNCNDLELGRFKDIQGQRSWCQSKAHWWFPIWPPLSPTTYLSPFSRYMTFKIFSTGAMVRINFTSGLADRNILDFHQKEYVTTHLLTIPWWPVWWRSVEECNL